MRSDGWDGLSGLLKGSPLPDGVTRAALDLPLSEGLARGRKTVAQVAHLVLAMAAGLRSLTDAPLDSS
jgi:hypothetical protein